jgi:hypothetical protein
MPQKFLPYKNKLNDGRVRILPSQYPKIRSFYKQVKSQRVTASYFGVSRRLITFILYPERLKKLQADRKKAKVHLKYYDRAKHTQAVRKYRAKKRAFKKYYDSL